MCAYRYIASLEEQQILLLSALRELRRKAPDNSDVCDTIEQLQRKGFDIESLRFKDPHRDSHKNEAPLECSSSKTPELEPWGSTQLTMEYLQSLHEQPATPQVVSDFLWHFGDATNQAQTPIQYSPQPVRWQSADSFFGTAPAKNIKRAIDPLSGLFVDPSGISFGLGNSNIVPS